jgi:hypothetical protein
MREPIRNGKSEIIGYRETGSGNREVLRDKTAASLNGLKPTQGLRETPAVESLVAAQTNCSAC